MAKPKPVSRRNSGDLVTKPMLKTRGSSMSWHGAAPAGSPFSEPQWTQLRFTPALPNIQEASVLALSSSVVVTPARLTSCTVKVGGVVGLRSAALECAVATM